MRAKIVCTLGPASTSPDAIGALIDAGLDVARVNFSHGTHQEHAARIELVRRLAAERQRPVAILGDLKGPRIRVGDLPRPVVVSPGDEIVLCHEANATGNDLPVTYDDLAEDVHPGDRILIDDGLLEFVVLEVDAPRVITRVLHGG